MPYSLRLSHFPADILGIISEYLGLPEVYMLLTSGDRNLIHRLKSESGIRSVRFTVPKNYDLQDCISYVNSRLPNVKEFSIRGRDYYFSDFGLAEVTALSSVQLRRVQGLISYSTNLPYEYSLKNGLVEKMEIYGTHDIKIPSSLTHLSLTRYEISAMDLDELTRAAPSLAVFRIPNPPVRLLCQNRPILPQLRVFQVSSRATFSTDMRSTEDLTESFFSFLPSGLEYFSHPKVTEVGYKFLWWSNLKHLNIEVAGQDKLVLPPQLASLELSGVVGYRQLPAMNFPSTLRRLRILYLDIPGNFVESLPSSLIYREF